MLRALVWPFLVGKDCLTPSLLLNSIIFSFPNPVNCSNGTFRILWAQNWKEHFDQCAALSFHVACLAQGSNFKLSKIMKRLFRVRPSLHSLEAFDVWRVCLAYFESILHILYLRNLSLNIWKALHSLTVEGGGLQGHEWSLFRFMPAISQGISWIDCIKKSKKETFYFIRVL